MEMEQIKRYLDFLKIIKVIDLWIHVKKIKSFENNIKNKSHYNNLHLELASHAEGLFKDDKYFTQENRNRVINWKNEIDKLGNQVFWETELDKLDKIVIGIREGIEQDLWANKIAFIPYALMLSIIFFIKIFIF